MKLKTTLLSVILIFSILVGCNNQSNNEVSNDTNKNIEKENSLYKEKANIDIKISVASVAISQILS